MGVSGSSGRLKQTFGRGPVKIDSQLLGFNRLPRVTGVHFHGSHTIACKRAVPNRQRPASARLRTVPWLHQSNVHPFRCHAPTKHLRAMLGIARRAACRNNHVDSEPSTVHGDSCVVLDLDSLGFVLAACGECHSFCPSVASVAVSL